MKKTLFILLVGLLSTAIYAQNNVFVLVDVSASRNRDINLKLEAKNQVYNLLMGKYLSNGWVAKEISDKKIENIVNASNALPLIEQNSWFCLMPFGNSNTYKNYQIIQNKNNPVDFQNTFNSAYPQKFNDDWTYMKIAEAFTVSLAKSYNIRDYYIFIISDGMEDNTGSKNPYDQFEEDLLMSYNNEIHSIVKNIGTLTKNKYYIYIHQVTNVAGSKIQPAPGIVLPPTTTSVAAVIKITSPVGTKKKPNEIKGESVNVSWRCPDCDESTTYTVSVVGTDGNKAKAKPIKTKNFSASFNNLSSGKYRITVSGDNGASSDTTYIEVSAGGAGWLLFLLLLIGAGMGGGYYLLENLKEKKTAADNSNNSSRNNNSSSDSSNSSDTSDDGMF